MKTFLVLAFLVSIAAVGINILMFLAHHSEQHCKEYKTVAAVGGCTSGGNCKVRFDDGTIGTRSMPIAGEVVCMGILTRWKK